MSTFDNESTRATGTTSIPLLTDSNWNQWEPAMVTYLELTGLWPYAKGEEEKPVLGAKLDDAIAQSTREEKHNQAARVWRINNTKTIGAIKTYIRPDLRYVITGEMTARKHGPQSRLHTRSRPRWAPLPPCRPS